jgi:hypothetical protein
MWKDDLPEELQGVIREDWFPRPALPIPYTERVAVACLAGYALGLRALRSRIANR